MKLSAVSFFQNTHKNFKLNPPLVLVFILKSKALCSILRIDFHNGIPLKN